MTDDDPEAEAVAERDAGERDAQDQDIGERDTEELDAEERDVAGDSVPEAAVDAFLELEAELADTEAETGTGLPEERPSGLVVGAETVPAGSVSDAYPLTVTSERALELRVMLRDGGRTTVYLDWPGEEGVEPDSPLGRLLAALDVPADAFADLYGETLLLEREGEHYTVLLPPEPPRGSGRWELGVVGGLAFNATVLGLFGVAAAGLPVGGVLSALTVPFLLVNLLLLPWATYRDARYLRTHSDWDQGPPFWGTLSMIPVVNVGVSALYLWSRSRARFLGTEPSLGTKFLRAVRGLL